jgi:sugar phosphate isomerase/epimerase
MQFIFSTGSLHTYGVDRCFELAARAGFDGIELMVDQRWDTRQPEYLQRLSDHFRLPIVAVHSPFAPHVPGWPDDEPGRIQASVRLAETVGAGVVVHHLPLRSGWLWVQAGPRRLFLPVPGWKVHAAYRRWLLEEYQTVQATTPVTLAIENMPARRWLRRQWNAHHWNSVSEIVRFPALTMDTTHLGTWGLEPVEVYFHLQGRVRHVHLSNFDGKEHRRPEDGRLRLDRLLAGLASDGYQGAVTLELQPDALSAGSPDDQVAALLTDSLTHCRAWAASVVDSLSAMSISPRLKELSE